MRLRCAFTMYLLILFLLPAAVPGEQHADEAGFLPEDTMPYDNHETVTVIPVDSLNKIEVDSLNTAVSSAFLYGDPHHLAPLGKIEPIQRKDPVFYEWQLYVLLFALFCLALAKYFFPGRLKIMMQSVFSMRLFLQADKENIVLTETPGYLLKINFLLCVSLLLFQTLDYYDLIPADGILHPLLIYAFIAVMAVCFYFLKHLMIRFLAWMFDTHSTSKAYFNNIFVVNHFAGLALLPLVFYQAFNPLSHAVHVAWILLIIINLYKIIRGAMLGHALADFSGYYLFLYLCGVELAPLLIIGKAASVYLF